MSSSLHPLGHIDGVLLYRKDPRRSPRYTPKCREDYALEVKSKKEPMRSIGPLKVPKPSPENYLMKKQRSQPSLPKGERHVCSERKPLIPDSKHKLRLIRKTFDYVATAIAEERRADRSKPRAIADSHKGHKYFPENSGLFPQYVNKKDYGQVPTYLQQHPTEERSNPEDDCCQLPEEEEAARACWNGSRKIASR